MFSSAIRCARIPVGEVTIGRDFKSSGIENNQSILDQWFVRQKVSKYGAIPAPTGQQPHMVVLGGCALDGSTFIVHDPATVPFLRCSFEQLLAIRRYREDGRTLDTFRLCQIAGLVEQERLCLKRSRCG